MTPEEKKRWVLFLFICIPLRSFIAYYASVLSNGDQSQSEKKIYGFAILLSVMGVGMLASEVRRYMTPGPHMGFGGGEVYWYSGVHGALYLISAGMLFNKMKNAHFPLILDVVIGLVTFFAKNAFL